VLRRAVGWIAQDRDGKQVAWREAARTFWPTTMFGLALAVSLWLSAPEVVAWAAPVLVAYILAAPFAVMSSFDAPDAEWPRRRLVAIPEEFDAPFEVRAVSAGPASAAGYAPPMEPFRFDVPASPGGYSAAASPAE
jgi:membrane glycosyltransferase